MPMPTELRRCAVLLLPGHSLLAAAGVLDLLRLANELQGDARYEGASVGIDELAAGRWFAIFVVGADEDEAAAGLAQLLQRAAAAGTLLAGIDGGGAHLAKAGLLAGERATVPWTLVDALIEEFPDVVWTGNVWEINPAGTLLTSAGGTASLDLMLAWLARLHGEHLAQELVLALGLERARGRDERQRRPISESRGGSPKLGEALSLMEANLAEPLPTEEVARLVGVSRRQLERLFKQHLDSLPSRYYLALRLKRARRLLQQSSQSILQIGLSCGFSSGPHFSNAYRSHFGHTPREERSQHAASWRKPGDPDESA
jgi:transcriptional regulator GlxA family with amidase domain